MIIAPPRTILEVFESLPEGTLCQLINDTLVMSPSPLYTHQRLISEIFRQLSNYVVEKNLGDVITAPMDVHFSSGNVYQPDILFIAKERMYIVQEGKVKGAPDLIIEVLSAGTERYDKKEKKAVYEQYGVKEYWIVAPETKEVTGYTLIDAGYKEINSTEGVISSRLFPVVIRF